MNNPGSVILGTLVVIFTFYTTIRAWKIALRYRPYILPFVLATGNSIAVGIVTYWALLAAFWPDDLEVPPHIIFINSFLALLLLIIPSINTWYLIYIDRRRNGGSERREDQDVSSHKLY